MNYKIVIWLIFTVVVSLIPLIFDRISGTTPTWKDFLGNGQLLLIGVALGAESLGDLLSLKTSYGSQEVVVMGISFLTTLSSSFMYPLCSLASIGGKKLLIPLELACPILFFSSLATSILCKFISANHMS